MLEEVLVTLDPQELLEGPELREIQDDQFLEEMELQE